MTAKVLCALIIRAGIANVEKLFEFFDYCESECMRLMEHNLPLPAYEMVLKASHAFNLLDARHAISVTERQRFILRVRTMARSVAESYYAAREALGFPMLNNSNQQTNKSGEK